MLYYYALGNLSETSATGRKEGEEKAVSNFSAMTKRALERGRDEEASFQCVNSNLFESLLFPVREIGALSRRSSGEKKVIFGSIIRHTDTHRTTDRDVIIPRDQIGGTNELVNMHYCIPTTTNVETLHRVVQSNNLGICKEREASWLRKVRDTSISSFWFKQFLS